MSNDFHRGVYWGCGAILGIAFGIAMIAGFIVFTSEYGRQALEKGRSEREEQDRKQSARETEIRDREMENMELDLARARLDQAERDRRADPERVEGFRSALKNLEAKILERRRRWETANGPLPGAKRTPPERSDG